MINYVCIQDIVHWRFYLISILLSIAFLVLSEQGIYVSRLTGYDIKTCGKINSPCRTISYGIQQLSGELYIFLDGTNTLKNPYTCQALDPGHPGIYVNKSVSFVSIKSRAYILCLHGNAWLVNGTEHKHGLRINFSGLAFLNTSVRLSDAFVAVDDTVFAVAKLVSIDILVGKLPRFQLSLNNVVFKKNFGCLTISPHGSNVFINITNTIFDENGNLSSNIPSILWLKSTNNMINLQIRNCSFKKNMITKNGMILVNNELGTTNVLLKQLKLEENGKRSSIVVFGGAFTVRSARVFISLMYGYIFKTPATFFGVIGQSAEINISNIDVDGFYSPLFGGGVFNLFQSDSCSFSIKHSSFRNGNNYGIGGVLFMAAPNSALIIQNCSIYNITSSDKGGTVYIQSVQTDYKQSTKRRKNTFARLHIFSSSFSYSSSGLKGGVVCINAEKLSVVIHDSLFVRCNAGSSGGALFFSSNDSTIISLHNSNFSENSAGDGAIIDTQCRRYECSYNLSVINNTFSKNRLHSQQFVFGIVAFQGACKKITVDLKNTHFIKNLAGLGASIYILFIKSTVRYVTFDTCIFRKNVGNLGTMYVQGKALLLTFKHSIFDSNSKHDREAITGNNLRLKDSLISIMNTTFVNNSCQVITAILEGASILTITNSDFVRNNNTRGYAPIHIFADQNEPNSRTTVFIEKVLFQENTAKFGVFYMDSGEAEFANCTFLNNFAISLGGIIMSGVGRYGRNSNKFVVRHSVFTQTITKFYNNTNAIMTTSFLKFFGPIKLTIVNSRFNQTQKSDAPLILVTTAIMIRFDSTSLSFCPLGHDLEKTYYGYDMETTGDFNNSARLKGLTFSCKQCDYNFYSLQRGTARGFNVDDTFQCLPCPRGADCVPAIRSKTNYWGYHVNFNPPKLAFTICPFGYCKSPPTNSTKYNACQGKRTGVMCGKCSQGYTEALWSTYCTPVKDCNDHWFWILFLALVFSMAIILVFKPPFVTYCLKQIFWFRPNSHTTDTQDNYEIIASSSLNEETPQENNISLLLTEQHKQDKRQFSRFVDIVFYFYQIAQLLLSSSTLEEFFDSQFLKPVLGFFNFQPSLTKRGFLCPFPGLTPESKLVFKVAPVFGTLTAIFFIYVLHSIISRTRGTIRPAIAPYFQASIKTVFLGYVTMATVSISLIRCVFVSDERRWFYNGNITCYQWWQYASFTFIAIFVIPFIFVLAVVTFKLYQDKITVRQFLLAIIFPLPFFMLWFLRFAFSSAVANVEENQNLNALKEMLLAPYRQPDGESKRGALYWQSVLIARRFVLVLIFCVVTEPSIKLFCMTIVCVVVLYCHVKVRPFQNSLANNLESISLFILIILGLISLFKSVFVGSEQNVKGSLITVFKVFQWLETVMLGLFPAVLLLLLFFAVISFCLRVLVVCYRLIFKFLFRPCVQRWMSRDTTSLLNVCDNTEDD